MSLPGSSSIDPPGDAELRAAEESMFAKVMAELGAAGFDAVKAARHLGLATPGGVIVFKDETDSAACADFLLTEARAAGRTLVEAADPARLQLNPLETEWLEAYRRSRASLFTVTAVRAESGQIHLRDALEAGPPEVHLTDPRLARWLAGLREWPVLFLRLLTMRATGMSSGLHFAFEAGRSERLLQAYRQKIKNTPAADISESKFRFFYQKHRELGMVQAVVTVPPPRD